MNGKIIYPKVLLLFTLLTIPFNLLNFQNCFSENTNLNNYNQTSLFFLDTIKKDHLKIDDAISYVREISDGEVISAERKFRKDNPLWELILIAGEGSFIKIEISYFEKTVLSVISEEGPFNYEIKPAPEFIPFSEAVKIADRETSQNTLKWKFLKVKDRWEYNFWLFTKSGKAQLRLDAETGEVVTSKKKKK